MASDATSPQPACPAIDALRDAVFEHHMKQHRGALAQSHAKNPNNAIYLLVVTGATSLNGKISSNGRGMFGGPLDTVTDQGKIRLEQLLGAMFAAYEHQVANMPKGGALVITQVELDGHITGGFSGASF